MASIRKRGNSYQIEVFDGSDDQGNPIRRSLTYHPKETAPTKVRKELEAVAADYERRIHSGIMLDGDHITFREAAERWFTSYAEKSLSATMQHEYRRILEKTIFPEIGRLPMTKIHALHIQNIVDALAKKNLAPSTIANTIKPAKAVFKASVSWGLVQFNPCDRIILPKKGERYKYKIWTSDQVRTFFAALDDQYETTYSERHRTDSEGNEYAVAPYCTDYAISTMYKALFMLLIYTSARRGEVCALTWNDIDFAQSEISITKAVAVVDHGQIIKAPKTEAGKRRIYVPAECMRILRKWKKEEIELSLALGDLWKGYTGADFNKNFLFIRRDSGELINIETVGQRFHQIVRMHNAKGKDPLPEIRLHDLRHTGASLMIANNVDIVTVSHRLGHAKPSTTLDIYSHAIPSKDKAAALVLSEAISV